MSRAPAPSLAANAVVTMLSRLLYLATRLLLPPLVLSFIGLEEYALWSTAFVLIMYIGLADAGFANVYVRFVARYHARGQQRAINRLLSTGVFTLAGLAAAVMLLLYCGIDLLLATLAIPAAQWDTARVLILGTAGMFLLDLSLGAFCYLLHGLQRMREEQTVAIIGYTLELLAIAGLLFAGCGVYSLLIAFVLRYGFSLLAFMSLARRMLPGLSVHPRHYDRRMLRHFLGYGSRVQASALVSTLLVTLDRSLAGLLFGHTAIALFELAGKLPLSAISIPAVISRVTMPAASQLQAEGAADQLPRLLGSSTRYCALLAAVPLGFMAAFAAPLGHVWLGSDDPLLAQLPVLLVLAAFAAQLHIMTGPGSAIFRALGQVRNEFIYHGLRVVLLAIALLTGFALFGCEPITLAAGLAAGNAAAALLYLVHNQRRMRLSFAALVQRSLLPAALPWAVAALLLPLWPETLAASTRLSGLVSLAGLGALYLLLLLPLFWWLVLDTEERGRLLAWLPGRLAPALREKTA
jgi:O-antigen/teichoic acid export membrane protein